MLSKGKKSYSSEGRISMLIISNITGYCIYSNSTMNLGRDATNGLEIHG